MKCRHTETRVADSRWREGRTWRRRVCFKCKFNIYTYEITAEEYKRFMDAHSELDEPRWAVIAVRDIKGTGLTYAEALEIMGQEVVQGEGKNVAISTEEAAARMRKPTRRP